MLVVVEVLAQGNQRPPLGALIRVEARDTSLADGPSRTLAAAQGEVRLPSGDWLDTIQLDVPELPDPCTIWAHVDVNRGSRLSRGDFVTTASYPVPPRGPARLTVTVRQV